ncbi:uncharacterized protein VTP21DRAFT_8563 [Calcarisporiella thermophila]|uniref:uncharacterized protein n=1 Tax=Calcarisporiella thermophila TaxID=911321 RepID=UPI0037449BFC
MPTFESRPLNPKLGGLNSFIKRRPFVFFGLPFITVLVVGSFGLQQFTKTRYEHHEHRVTQLKKEDELNMSKGKRRLSLQEEYWRLQAHEEELDSWESKRVPRPEGVPDNVMKS